MWTQLTIGHLSRNKYWGESDSEAYHSVLATSSLIIDDGVRILIDPSVSIEEMDGLLRRHAGIGAEDIDIVYATHFHGDHWVDALKYPNAVCFMPNGSLADANRTEEEYLKPLISFKEAPEKLSKHTTLLPLPGHTPGLCGVILEEDGIRVLFAGDSIMGPEFFLHRDGYWFNEDLEETRRSIDAAVEKADVIVPGHGDAFAVENYDFRKETACLPELRRLSLPGRYGTNYLLKKEGENILFIADGEPEKIEQDLFDRSGMYGEAIHTVCFMRESLNSEKWKTVFPEAEWKYMKK